MHRPIVVGALTGLVMGHFTEGLIIGGTMELAWMGFLPYAGMISERRELVRFWELTLRFPLEIPLKSQLLSHFLQRF